MRVECIPVLLVAGIAASVGTGKAAGRTVKTVTITVDRSAWQVSRFSTGVTHTQYSLDPWGSSTALSRAKELLRANCRYQNQHLMGWGAENPEPSPGVYRWGNLDRRVKLIEDTGGTPVITLCAAPDWMKGGTAGATDWSRIEVAPLPEHYADFAALAARVARRYRRVKHFQVWNKMKGFWKASINNWDYQGYTRLYNLVYDALKKVDAQIKVGGPYLVIEGTGSGRGDWASEDPIRERQWTVLDYWLRHKHGADFLTVDKGLIDHHDKGTYTPAQAMALTHWFGDVARQLRQRTDLPLWWAEYYGRASVDVGYETALYASILKHMVSSGGSVALLWQPQQAQDGLPGALFTDTRHPDGGRALPHLEVFGWFHRHFSTGARLYRVASTSVDVETLAGGEHLLLINKLAETVDVAAAGSKLTLLPFQVRLVNTSNRHSRSDAPR